MLYRFEGATFTETINQAEAQAAAEGLGFFPLVEGVEAGEEAADGFGYRKAPTAEGLYDLYEFADGNQHEFFRWINQPA